MRESCLKGNAAGVKPIFGYWLVNKKYVIEENEAEIVRKLFSDYMDGKISKEDTSGESVFFRAGVGNVEKSEVYREMQLWRNDI